MMTFLLQSSFCLLLFYMVYALCFKQHTNHTFNRFYLLSTLLLSIIIPWIEITTSVETTGITSAIGRTIQANLEVDKSVFTTADILLSIYLIGVLITSFVFLYKLFRLLNIIRKGERQVIEGHNVVNINEEIGICSFLKYIIVPLDKHNTITRFELTHESSHINQFHSIDIIVVWIYQSIFWFNPIAYLYRTRLLEVHEFLADRDAIQLTGKSSYQAYILKEVSQKLQPQLVNNFKSIIKTRLIMMNSKSKPPKWSYLAALAVFSLSVFLFSCQTKKITKIHDNPSGTETWLTETLIDTTVVIDYDTYEESISISKRELQFRLDTIVLFDAETFEESLTVTKIYSEESKKFLEERAQNF